MLFKRIKDQTPVFFIDQDIVVRKKNRMVRRNHDRRKGCASGEGTVSDVLEMIRALESGQCIAGCKSILSELRKAFRKSDRPETAAFSKGFRADKVQGVREGHRRKGGTRLKSGIIDFSDRWRNRYTFQGRTADKAPFTDGPDALGNDDGCQAVTP